HVPLALWAAMDLVEAAVRTGRPAEAAAHVTAAREAGIAAISPRLALLASGAEAIAAPDGSALGLFGEALAIAGADRFPFDLARVQLCYRGAPGRGPPRPRAEQRAPGQPGAPADQREPDSLTPQEREIAMLAAAGLT